MPNRIITATFSIIILALAGFFYYQRMSVCKNPLAYDLGVFDNRFRISREKLINTIKEAENVWEKETKYDFFVYKPGARFKVNLLFDQRQSKTIAADQSEEYIGESRSSYDILFAKYESTIRIYENNLRVYNLVAEQFEQNLNYYNAKIAEINSRGGAKPEEFKELEAEKINLQKEKSDMDKTRQALNSDANKLNLFGNQVNELARKLNIEVDVHNQRFGEAREFDQGEYQGNQINIYQFEGISHLRLVLAHELGHALGLDHIENPKSIMYYLMEKQDLNNPSLTEEDKEALLKRCEFHILK